MSDSSQYCLVMTTTDSESEAGSLAEGLVESRLAACVQLSRVVSHYLWQGAATRNDEILMLIKTRASKVPGIKEYIDQNHSYQIPELIELPITSGLPAYLGWIDQIVS